MKIAIIEDQPEKLQEILYFLEEFYEVKPCIKICESLKSGLILIKNDQDFDLILLDMSMPVLDAKHDSHGLKPENFAGRELMKQMKIRGISVPVVVVTQYAVFEKDNITLAELNEEFEKSYQDFYKGCVYFQSSSDDWMQELAEVLRGCNEQL
ncbi:response regulator [Gilvimarinus sp. SDUM040013]|uniref:Response regulator n=1 Tax=Gilvimarinus gilvus TaxID=3058038 RepID=A0ABU4S3S8_9GAMM|nr:response regulator [Gilvimarinus sp. SDUM040013]MDO3385635.1 response regulator [Gilvimarinus sp. SDUM040013]MDX6849969.1 response regulator [Gilvimarinus sp. SDUM040013]